MSKRDAWLFQFTAVAIADGASQKAMHERDREAWWQAEYEKAVEAAKEGGSTVREYDVTGGKRAQMLLDPALSQRVEECYTKRDGHRLKGEEYERWVSVLRSQEQNHVAFELDAQDVLYFGLGQNGAP